MSTTYLDAHAALLAAAQAALTSIVVLDGPALKDESALKRLWVGQDMDPQAYTAEGGNAPDPGTSGIINIETFTIVCLSESWSGGGDFTSLQADAFGVRSTVGGLLRPDSAGRTLGVVALSSAYLGAWQLYRLNTSKGPYVGLSFRCEFVARPTVN